MQGTQKFEWVLCGGRYFTSIEYSPYVITVFVVFFSFRLLFYFSSLWFWMSKKLGWRVCFCYLSVASHWAVMPWLRSLLFLFYRLLNDNAHTIHGAVTVLFSSYSLFLFFFFFYLTNQLQWGSQDGYTQRFTFSFLFKSGRNK